MVFRKDYNGKVFYNIGITQTQPDGQKINGYMPVRFKRGVELENKSKIKIKQAFENFYKKGFDTIFYLQITDFELLDDKIEAYTQAQEEADLDMLW